MKKRGLGKGMGIGALIPGSLPDEKFEKPTTTLSINDIEPNRDQPRKEFDQEKLEILADSLKQYGIVQPLIVVKEKNYYKIVAGERRWRAAKIAGIKDIPVIIKEYTALEIEEIALIENLQRENLNPLEEAAGYKQLMDKFKLTQEEVSEKIGKSRSSVANALRMLNLPDFIQTLVKDGKLSTGHAKVLLGVKNESEMIKLAKTVVDKDLNVRQTELLVKLGTPKKEKKASKEDVNVANAISDSCRSLEKKYGTKIKIKYSSTYKGKIEISFKDLKQMTSVLEEMGK